VILKNVARYKSSQKLIFAFEFGMFGGSKLLLGLIPPLLFFIKVLGKKIYLVSHGVILNFSDISGQMGVPERGFLSKSMGVLLKSYYFILGLLSTKIIVFEEHLRKSLIGIGIGENKIYTIPHGVHEEGEIPSKTESRKKLGIDKNDFMVLCFGFLIWYKGSDFIVNAFRNKFKEEGITLIMAGGESNVHKKDPVYARYISNLYKNVEGHSNIVLTGFLKEEDIKYYFSACDLVVLPYRAFISASGPLSFALTYKKPFVISSNLKEYAKTADFKKSLSAVDMSVEDIVFNMDEDGFHKRILEFVKDEKKLALLQRLSSQLFNKRKWTVIGDMYNRITA